MCKLLYEKLGLVLIEEYKYLVCVIVYMKVGYVVMCDNVGIGLLNKKLLDLLMC